MAGHHQSRSTAGEAALPSRREAVEWFLRFVAASPLLSQAPAGAQERQQIYWPDRLPPLDGVVNALEMETVAEKSLPKSLYDHIAGGAGSESTLRRNREFFDRITLRPRVLVNVEGIDLSTTLFGQTLYSPILIGPTANHKRLHPDGELATAAGARAAQALMVISGRSTQPLADVVKAAGGAAWFQIDASGDDAELPRRAETAAAQGCKAVCLTLGVSSPIPSRRDIHNGRATATAYAAPTAASISWPQIEALKRHLSVPLLVKGILSAAEAQSALDHGVDGIVVSNHGGRVIDGAPATIEMLPEISDVIAKRIPVLIDGGFRRGTDLLKALALGADAVLLGRPVLWALAAYGAAGVERLLVMLQHELALSMGLAGQPNIAGLSRSLARVHSR
ncbi:MAG TPA: alpha-hydroxy acid oxidase [Bryobacterales bacterium]|nr:alpha-hydroxy acid oxidase [Bryobacterales bacterium]